MNRIFLLLEFLKHRPQAQQILADLIDEEGDPALAQLVRSRKKADRKQLQLALEVTPFRVGTQLGIDYFVRATSFGLEVPELNEQLRSARQWIAEVDIDSDPATDQCRSIIDQISRRDISRLSRRMSGRGTVYALGESISSLMVMLQVTCLILDSLREQDFERVSRRTNRHRTALVNLSKFCRWLPRPLIQQVDPDSVRFYSVKYNTEQQLNWQWDHLIDVLQQACAEDIS